MRALHIAGWALAALVVLLLVAAGIAAATFDPAAAIIRVAATVKRSTGRDLAVAGPVRLQWSWPPSVVVENATLSNPPGLSRPEMVRVGRAVATVATGPLLSGRAELDITLQRPDVLLEGGNWQFHPEPPPPSTTAPGPSRPPLIRTTLRRLRVEEGRLGYRDQRGVQEATVPALDIALDPAGTRVTGRVAGQGGAFDLTGSAGVEGWPLQFHANGAAGAEPVHLFTVDLDAPAPDQVAHLRLGFAVRGVPVAADLGVPAPGNLQPGGALPFTLALASPGATATVSGTVALLRGFDLVVSARVADLAALSTLAGTPLPALGAVSLDTRLLDPAVLRSGVALRSLRITTPQGDLAGDVALGWAGRPSLRGTLTSTRLDLDAIRAAIPAQVPAAAPPAPSAAQPPAEPAPTRLIPDRTLPLAPLRRADADLQFSAANVTAGGVPLAGVNGHLALSNGRLRLDPVNAVLGGGAANATLAVNAAEDAPAINAVLHAAGVRLDGLTTVVHGTATLDATLAATGATTRQLLTSLDGSVAFDLVNGDIDNQVLAVLLAEPLRAAHVGLDLSGRSALRCIVLQADAHGGTARFGTLLLDAQRVRLDGSGTADLENETLQLQLRPLVRIGPTGVATALRVSGPWAHPAVALDAGAGRVGVSIGGAAPPDPEVCGPAPPETPAPKPADLLRRFLR